MQSTQYAVVKHAAVKITAEQALATIREVKIAVDGVMQVVGGLVRPMNGLLDALLNQIQTIALPSVAFAEAEGKLTIDIGRNLDFCGIFQKEGYRIRYKNEPGRCIRNTYSISAFSF